LTDSYDLGWLVDQELRGNQLSLLSDSEVTEILRKLERAHECILEGVGFDEAGLVAALLTEG
jgi:hypothetical protein